MASTTRNKTATKTRGRISVSIPLELERSINGFVKTHRITMSKFAREALEKHLKEQRKAARHAELAETCRLLADVSAQVMKDWAVTEYEGWPE